MSGTRWNDPAVDPAADIREMLVTAGSASWEESTDFVAVSRSYGFELFDYGDHRAGNGLLLAVGAGALLATMDVVRSLRYAIDLGPRKPERAELIRWLPWANRFCWPVVVNAWFSISDPEVLRYGLEAVDSDNLFVCSNVDLGRGMQFRSLGRMAGYVAAKAARR